MKTRMVFATLLAGLALFPVACDRAGGGNTPPQKITIGASLPLSGPMAFYGQEVQRGLQLALAQDSGITVVYEDNRSNARDAVTVFNKFASRGDIPLVVSSNSPLSAPLRDLAQQDSIVLLAMVTGASNFAKNHSYVFRDAITQTAEAPPLARYAADSLRVRRVATLVVNDDYGLDGARNFVAAFTAAGGTVVAQETFESSEGNLRAQLTKIKQLQPDAVYIVGREQNLISAVVQAVELDVAPQILSGDSFDSENVIRSTGQAAERVVFVSYYVNLDGSEQGRAFKEAFVRSYGEEPSIYAIDAFVAGHYLADVIRRSGASPEAIRTNLASLDMQSIKGRVNVSPDRDIVPPIAIYRIRNGEKQLLSALPRS